MGFLTVTVCSPQEARRKGSRWATVACARHGGAEKKTGQAQPHPVCYSKDDVVPLPSSEGDEGGEVEAWGRGFSGGQLPGE